MKHIKKVFLQLNKDAHFPIDETERPQNLQQLKNISEQLVIRRDEEDNNYLAFIYKDKARSEKYVINIPIMPMVFFDSAYTSNLHLRNAREKLLDGLAMENTDGIYYPQIDHNVYRFIGYSTSTIILLCNSLECFANEMIARNKYVYTNVLKQKSEVYDHNQIQNNVDFKTKLFIILPAVFNKKPNPTSLFLQAIHRLIDLRNDITHLKLEENLIIERSAITRRLLSHDYDKSLVHVREFINYFLPNYLQDCDCEGEF